ncbi:MAG TPA: BadF/BadG/BcrA/BcrD ATPase family protein [Candidatus Acidoferrales bacterium]|nr:BadF/BadG/BcrA/BcrD ATPase family protein [Candidatus Acidoferrales bacterium]
MIEKIAASDASYFLGFDGGGTKTECVLADRGGHVITRAVAGPSNPLRTGYARAWFALSEAGDRVLAKAKIHAAHVRAVCAGLGGAGRHGVVRRVATFLEGSYPNATIRVTTDLDIALDAAFGPAEGMILLAGTGSAAFGRDLGGRTARAGGLGPWVSDEGGAFDIGRRAVWAVVRSGERRGPATALCDHLFPALRCTHWDALADQIFKNPDDVFPRTFPLVADLADQGDAVSREIMTGAAGSLAELVVAVTRELGWQQRDFLLARMGGVHGRCQFLDAAIEAELEKRVPRACLVRAEISPAEAAVRMAERLVGAEGNAA